MCHWCQQKKVESQWRAEDYEIFMQHLMDMAVQEVEDGESVIFQRLRTGEIDLTWKFTTIKLIDDSLGFKPFNFKLQRIRGDEEFNESVDMAYPLLPPPSSSLTHTIPTEIEEVLTTKLSVVNDYHTLRIVESLYNTTQLCDLHSLFESSTPALQDEEEEESAQATAIITTIPEYNHDDEDEDDVIISYLTEFYYNHLQT
jgi:hypothetical protein